MENNHLQPGGNNPGSERIELFETKKILDVKRDENKDEFFRI